MNKKELKEFMDQIKIGDCFYDLEIEGLKREEVSTVLQELAREKKLQFLIESDCTKNISYQYTVITPSKKFLNREGQWSHSVSKKIDEFLEVYRGYLTSEKLLQNVFTVSEAAEKWGIDEGTIRKAIKSNRFIEYRKSGRITLVTKAGMIRVFGER